jgi:uncharacterized damage-inducible protein DinB
MQPDQIKTLFDYHWFTTERLLDMAGELPDEVYHASLDYGRGSIHELLFHLIAADQHWRISLETGKQQRGVGIKDHPDREALKRLLVQEKAAWQDYISGLRDADLSGEVTLTTLRGREHSFHLWHILVHLALHGMQHHSELAQALSVHDLSPGDIDFIFYRGTA